MNTIIENKTKDLYLKIGVTLCFLVFFVFLGVVQLSPPAPRAAHVPTGQFSAAQAFTHLQSIAQKAHPLHSQEKEKVRDYIVQQIQAMGLEAILQKTHRKDELGVRDWNLENILTRIKGTASTGALLVVAHYDSVPSGPGASDDGAAVSAALVALQHLRSLPPLKNDVIVLFSDGEEYGLLGAYQFAQEHPWSADVSMVFNYEARGHKGPSLMFQTNDQNGWVIAEFAKAAPYPRAYSWSDEVYKHMPNDTDFTVFNKKGLAGLNFAFIGGWKYYHTAKDNLNNISHSSLQHHGENMLPLLLHFGNLDLKHTKAGNRVYFSVFNTLVNYPLSMVYIVLILSGFGFIALLFWGIKMKHLKISHLFLGFILFLISLVVSAFVLWLAVKSIKSMQPDYFAGYFTSALACIACGVFSLLYYFYLKRFSMVNLFGGALLMFLILHVIAVILAPGASYMLAWPLVFGLGLWALRLKRTNPGWGDTLLQWLLVLPAFLVFVPAIILSVDALGIRLVYIVANLFIVLLASLLIPLWSDLLKPLKWWCPLLFFGIGIGMMIWGH